jgi:hypothetical protein
MNVRGRLPAVRCVDDTVTTFLVDGCQWADPFGIEESQGSKRTTGLAPGVVVPWSPPGPLLALISRQGEGDRSFLPW